MRAPSQQKGGTSPFIHFHSLYEKKRVHARQNPNLSRILPPTPFQAAKKEAAQKTHGAIFGTASSFSILYFLFNEALDFRSKIFLLLFNAFAKLIADKANGFGILFFQETADGLIRIHDEFLINQAVFLIEFLDAAHDHLFDDLFRFAFVASLFSKNFLFMVQNISRHNSAM